MLHRTLVYLTLIALPLLLTSCHKLDSIDFKKLNNLNIEQNKGSLLVTANVEMYNPNNRKFVIETADIDVYVEDTYIGKLQLPNEIMIPAKANFSATCSINVKMGNMLLGGLSVMGKLRKGEVNARFAGTMKVRFMFASKTLKIDNIQKIKIE